MNPSHVRGSRNLRFDLVLEGVGRITNSAGTSKLREFRRREQVLRELHERGQLEALKEFKAGRLKWPALLAAKQRGRLTSPDLLAEIALRDPLWKAIDATLPTMAKTVTGRRRYEDSFVALKAKAAPWLPETAKVRDLAAVDWDALWAAWGASAADYNRMRAAVSAFLTKHTGDVYSPFRRRVVAAVPRQAEPKGAEPDITPDLFWAIWERLAPVYRPAVVTLVLTGMRIKEYLDCTADDLMPARRMVLVPGTKTDGSRAVVGPFAPEWWDWIARAVPCDLAPAAKRDTSRGVQYDRRYKLLWRAWRAAAEAEGARDLTPHSLRHALAIFAVEAHAPVNAVQAAMRHEDPGMTARYFRTKDKGTVAELVGQALTASRAARETREAKA